MLKKNKYASYLSYAIGEIILVVIGILIAVSLNNWNEKRKSQIELDKILATISTELTQDIQRIDTIVTVYKKNQPIYVKVVNNQLSKEDYFKNPQYTKLIFGFPELNFNIRGFELLKNFNKDTNHQKDSLIHKVMQFYTKSLHEVNADNELRKIDFEENFSHWKNNYPWWSDYVIGLKLDGFMEYALNDQDYKNRVANNYFIAFSAFLPEINKFKRKALNLINDIKSIKH